MIRSANRALGTAFSATAVPAAAGSGLGNFAILLALALMALLMTSLQR